MKLDRLYPAALAAAVALALAAPPAHATGYIVTGSPELGWTVVKKPVVVKPPVVTPPAPVAPAPTVVAQVAPTTTAVTPPITSTPTPTPPVANPPTAGQLPAQGHSRGPWSTPPAYIATGIVLAYFGATIYSHMIYCAQREEQWHKDNKVSRCYNAERDGLPR